MGYYHVSLSDRYDVPDLPEGYAFKGGSARWLLNKELVTGNTIAPRDTDIIRLTELEPNDTLDRQLSQQLMPDDYTHGHGVELVEDLQSYFNSHDFTINEIYATSDEIVVTKACLEDTLNGMLRLSEYEQDNCNNKLLAKAIRFKAESEITGNIPLLFSNTLENILLSEEISPFHLALHLDRALGRGEEFAKKYVDILKEYNQIPCDIYNIEELINHISQYVDGFDYRNLAANHIGDDPFERLSHYLDTEDDICGAYHKKDVVEKKSKHPLISSKKLEDNDYDENTNKNEDIHAKSAKKWTDYVGKHTEYAINRW